MQFLLQCNDLFHNGYSICISIITMFKKVSWFTVYIYIYLNLNSIFVHLRNALKYTLLSITAIIALTNSKILWAISATISTSYAIYWDLHEDWGLIEYNGNRIKIVPSNRMFKPYVYIVAGIIDIILRLTWLERIFDVFF